MNVYPSVIHSGNILQIYRLLYEEGRLTQNEIEQGLSLSRPTVTSALSSLEKAGLILVGGRQISDGAGRQARFWAIDPQFFVSIGVRILPGRLLLCA